jgi:hypothetical protein
MKTFNVELPCSSLDWTRLAKEIDYLENHFDPKTVIEIFDTIFISHPRTAIFRVFSQKCKDLIQKSEINDAVMSGDYNVSLADPNIYAVFLTS